MTDDELRGFLAEQKIVSVATLGPNGRPHLMPLWYVPDGIDRLDGWTYAASQKAKNLERDPHATLQVEAGVDYSELRGAMFECDVEVVVDFAMELVERYLGGGEGAREGFTKQAPKRVALEFVERDRVTWDHRKLGGTY